MHRNNTLVSVPCLPKATAPAPNRPAGSGPTPSEPSARVPAGNTIPFNKGQPKTLSRAAVVAV